MTKDRRGDALLLMVEVRRRTGLSRTSIYRRMEVGTFPQKVSVSVHSIRWYESDIDAWVADPMGWRATA